MNERITHEKQSWSEQDLREMYGNDEIGKIAFQSRITQHSYSDPKHPDLDGFIVSQEKLDKFAQLILTEVISTIYISEIGDFAKDRLTDQLEDKFGLKL